MKGGLCGTVSQTLVAVWRDRSVEIRERIWDAEEHFHQHHYTFCCD